MADAFETLLLAWGVAYGEAGLAVEYRRRLSNVTYHPIAEGMTFAPGKRPKRVTRVLGRDGRSRRRTMGAAAGLLTAKGKGLPIPVAFCDPVPCKSRTKGGGFGTMGRPVPTELTRVEAAVHALEEISMLRAVCLRAHYCLKGDQSEKLEWITERIRQVSKMAEPIKLKRFRDELQHARFFVVGYLAAQAGRVA
jgi:hypothetical protein